MAVTPAQAPSTAQPPLVDVNYYDFLRPPQAEGELGWLAQYRIRKVLGQGGMGVVFLAEDSVIKRQVALKVMLPSVAQDEQARQQLYHEARAAARLQHDHVITVHEIGEDNGVPYLAMELLKGCTLSDWMARGNRPSVSQILRIGREAALGIAAAHDAGLIHRDLKPGNLWLEAPLGRVKILDFGLARRMADDTGMTVTGTLIGTPAYIAPEQARTRDYDHRVDLFSLGCILYEVATGKLAFRGETAMGTVMSATFDKPVPVQQLNPNIPNGFAVLIDRLMAKNPADRPPTAHVVAEELSLLLRARLSGTRVPLDPGMVSAVQSLPGTPHVNPMARTEVLPILPSLRPPPRSAPTPRQVQTVPSPRVEAEPPPEEPSSPSWKVATSAFAVAVVLLASTIIAVLNWPLPEKVAKAKPIPTPTKTEPAPKRPAGPILSPEEAAKRLEQTCTVEFDVVGTEGNLRAYLYNRATEKESTFAVILSEKCLPKLKLNVPQAREKYIGQRIRVTGKVTNKHRDPSLTGKFKIPHIFVDETSQFEVVGPAVSKSPHR
jgi:serine/threonine protein kinase